MDGLNNNYRRVCRIRIVKEIILNQSQLDILTEHAMKSGQDESCAMLLGIQKEEQWNLKEIFLTKNVSQKLLFVIYQKYFLQCYFYSLSLSLKLLY